MTGDPTDHTIADLRQSYRDSVIAWRDARDTAKIANRLFKANHKLYKELRLSAEGRTAISGLLYDPDDAVRLSAATHCLAWNEAASIAILHDLEQNSRTLFGFDAKYTLKAFRAGTLDLDW